MERKRALKIATRTLIVATVIIFIVSAYNIVLFFSGMIYSSSNLGLNLDQTDKGDYIISLSVSPTNHGFLEVDLSARLTVFDENGNAIGSNVTVTHILPGQSGSSHVSLTLPASQIPGGNIQNARGSMQLELDVRTLWSLVGFKNVLRAGSGQQ